jgi:pyruvate dehydrogenase E1 component alpha subunit
MPCCVQVDGMDLQAVYDALTDAAEYARSGQGSFFLEAITYRYRGHSMGDPERYRQAHEIEEKKKDDPITAWGEVLKKAKVATESELEKLAESALQEVEAAIEFAHASPLPAPEELYTDVTV